MSSLCGRKPLTMIGGGKEPFQLRGSAVADTNMGGWEKTSWPERRLYFARSWGVRLADTMA